MLIYLLALHFIADFLLQPRWMGAGKSSNDWILLQHLAIQFSVITVGLVPPLTLQYMSLGGGYSLDIYALAALCTAVQFGFLNALIHGVIDRHLWRGYKLFVGYRLRKQHGIDTIAFNEAVKNFKFWEDGLFFDTIGFDQFLHGATLIALASYLL